MGGYVPNPIAVVVLKSAMYSLYGWIVSARAEKARNPIVFGLLRVGAGWVVGVPTFLAIGAIGAMVHAPGWAGFLLAVPPRLWLWSKLLSFYFQPKGGRAALAGWAIGGTCLSTATDLIIFALFEHVDLLRIGIC